MESPLKLKVMLKRKIRRRVKSSADGAVSFRVINRKKSNNISEFITKFNALRLLQAQKIEHHDLEAQLEHDDVSWNIADLIWEASRLRLLGMVAQLSVTERGVAITDCAKRVLYDPSRWDDSLQYKKGRTSIHRWMVGWNRIKDKLAQGESKQEKE